MRKAVNSFLVFLTVFFYPFREKCHETKQIVSNLLTIFVMCHLFFGRFKEITVKHVLLSYTFGQSIQNVCFLFPSIQSKVQ